MVCGGQSGRDRVPLAWSKTKVKETGQCFRTSSRSRRSALRASWRQAPEVISRFGRTRPQRPRRRRAAAVAPSEPTSSGNRNGRRQSRSRRGRARRLSQPARTAPGRHRGRVADAGAEGRRGRGRGDGNVKPANAQTGAGIPNWHAGVVRSPWPSSAASPTPRARAGAVREPLEPAAPAARLGTLSIAWRRNRRRRPSRRRRSTKSWSSRPIPSSACKAKRP